jgi:hypothetical protein
MNTTIDGRICMASHSDTDDPIMSLLDDYSLACRFQNIGHNCEFGLVLEALGSTESCLLRWANVETIDHLIAGLELKFARLFARREILVPCFGDMVKDSMFGIAFHSKIQLAMKNDRWMIPQDAELIYQQELEKIVYLTEKFRCLAEAGTIFVYKGNSGISDTNNPVSDADAQRLYVALTKFGGRHLLVVDAATPQFPAGTLRTLHEGLYRGYVPRLAPYFNVRDFDLEGWRIVLQATQAVCA